MNSIYYKNGYKYQLDRKYMLDTKINPTLDIKTDYITLLTNGELVIEKGYAWDGPSGPTIDTKNFMRGSLVHDALYKLMRLKHLDDDLYRESIDQLLRQICKEDGMSLLRAWWVYIGVRGFGASSADPANKKRVTEAP